MGTGRTSETRPFRLNGASGFFRRLQHRHLHTGSGSLITERTLERQAQNELTALARLAVQENVAAVFPKNLAANGQTQAGPFRAFAADERFEDVRLLVGRDADAIIEHADPHP